MDAFPHYGLWMLFFFLFLMSWNERSPCSTSSTMDALLHYKYITIDVFRRKRIIFKMEEMVSSVVNVDDRIKVYWPYDDGSTQKVVATVTGVQKCTKMKQNSQYKYTLRFQDADVERSTRLLHLKWKKLSKKQKQNHNETIECAAIRNSKSDECLPTEKKQKRAQTSNNDVRSSDTDKLSTSHVLPAHSNMVTPTVGGNGLAFRFLSR
jgi:hypothetical protein